MIIKLDNVKASILLAFLLCFLFVDLTKKCTILDRNMYNNTYGDEIYE